MAAPKGAVTHFKNQAEVCPGMFRKPEPLNPERHAGLRYEPNIGYRFAAEEVTVPVVAVEALMAARDYILVFHKTDATVLALLAVAPKHNAHVNERGQWIGRYQPAFIRSYPFALVQPAGQAAQGAEDRRFTVVVDAEAPQFGDPEGAPLFDGDGKPTALLTKVQQSLATLYTDRERTRRLVGQLQDAGLLVERSILLKGQDRGLTGFRVIDTKALEKLEPAHLGRLRDSGALTVAFAQIMSLSNLQDGVLARSVQKTPDGAGERKVRELFDGDFDIDLDFMN